MTSGGIYRSTHDQGGEQSDVSPEPITRGMDPRDVGDRVLQAIKTNELYIFPHGEFKDEVADYFQRMLDAFPPAEGIDPERAEMEAKRAKSTEEVRKASFELDN